MPRLAGDVFLRAAKTPNGNIFVDIEGFLSAMFEQVELQGTQMGPNGPPNAKGTA